MGNKEDLTNNVIDIVKKITKCNNIDKYSSQENINQWDSLAYMSIISDIELKYKIIITQDNLIQFNSIQSIVNLISKAD